MKRQEKRFLLFIVGLMIALLAVAQPSALCPEDDCMMVWQDSEFCVGVKCRTVDTYYCYCCDKTFQFYRNN